MKIVIRPDLQQFVNENVEAGRFANTSEIVNAALTALQAQEAWIADNLDLLRREAAVGLEQADRGEFVEFEAKEIMAEGRKFLAAKRARRRKAH